MYRMLTLIAAAVLAGCGGGDSDGLLSPGPVAGIYVLESIGGKTLPAVLVDENGYTLTVIKGSYSLTSSGNYETSLTIRESIETTKTPSVTTYDETGSGVYSLAAQFVRFTDSTGRETTAQLSGAVLTFGADPARVYRR